MVVSAATSLSNSGQFSESSAVLSRESAPQLVMPERQSLTERERALDKRSFRATDPSGEHPEEITSESRTISSSSKTVSTHFRMRSSSMRFLPREVSTSDLPALNSIRARVLSLTTLSVTIVLYFTDWSARVDSELI